MATEAASALLDFAAQDLELDRIFAMTHPANLASLRIMERVGLVFTERRGGELVFELPSTAEGQSPRPPGPL